VFGIISFPNPHKYSVSCSNISLMNVSRKYSGEVYCELFQGDSRYTLDNMLQKIFVAFRASSKLMSLFEKNQKDLDLMNSCPEFRTCNGWCSHQRYLSVRHNQYHNANCCGLFDLITHARNICHYGPNTISSI